MSFPLNKTIRNAKPLTLRRETEMGKQGRLFGVDEVIGFGKRTGQRRQRDGDDNDASSDHVARYLLI